MTTLPKELEREIFDFAGYKLRNGKYMRQLNKNAEFEKLLSENDSHNIQRILIDNKYNYETYPNDYIYCLISNHCYCFKFDFKSNNTKLRTFSF